MLNGLLITAICCASLTLGGGLYEYLVVDPFWPQRPDLIQPSRGGISRGRFWILAHTLFEIVLIVCLVLAWKTPNLRFWLLLALASHATTRLWSALYFIPKALAFEKAATVDEVAARKWTRRSLLRFPIELLAFVFLFLALRVALQL